MVWWGVVALVAGQAQAADLETWIIAWATELDGDRGSDGRDEVLDLAIDQTQHVTVTGFVDGDPGEGRTGLLATFERNDGSVLWNIREEAGVLPNATDDVLTAVDFAPGSNDLAWCGQLAGIDSPKPTDPRTAYHVDAREPDKFGIHYESMPLWNEAFEVVPGSMGDQACRGLDRAGLTLFTTGDAATPEGGRQWITRIYNATTGDVQDGGTFALPDPAAVERGEAIAGDAATGNFVVVGSSALPNANSSAVIRFMEAGGTQRWSDRIASPGDGPARFHDVVYDVTRGLVAAVGTVQRGNEAASDIQGIVRVYAAAGANGEPAVQLELELGSAAGDDYATSVAFDQSGRLVVGGSVADATTGIERWQVLRLSETTGAVEGDWEGPVTSGHSRIQALAQRDEVLVVGGFVDRGNTVDAAVTMLGPDRDGDATADIADQCPDDPNKILQGVCDCGTPDEDRDGDDFEDCIDRCPDDPNKTTRMGECGCGVPDDDTDNDGILDCLETCPNDPNKVEPGACGCDVQDIDRDRDGVADCNDACEATPDGAEVGTDGCEARGAGCGCQSVTPISALLAPLCLILISVTRRRHGQTNRNI
ncbi:MAG: hypothetical protein AAGA48_33430 [Myxococcota bacterium]